MLFIGFQPMAFCYRNANRLRNWDLEKGQTDQENIANTQKMKLSLDS
jgi:hypothetical protein